MIKRFFSPKVLSGILVLAIALTAAQWVLSRQVVAVQNETYKSLKIFADVLGIIQKDYAEEKESKELIYSALKGMVKQLDPHSSFLTPEDYKEMQIDTKGVFGGIGIEISMRDGVLTVISPIEDTPADRAGIEAGDKIVKIEDKLTKDMSLTDAVKLMRGKKGTELNIHIMREAFNKPKLFTLTRARIKIKSVKFEKLDDGFGYVRLAQFQENSSKDLRKALKKITPEGGLKGLVLDLRNNPGGLLTEAVGVSDIFLSSGMIVYTKGRDEVAKMEFRADAEGTEPDYPIIVLVNGGSASASEIVAGALQDHKRAVILGTQSFGKGSVQTIIPLSDGSAVRLTTSKYYTPLGRSIQAKGIEPDIIVEAAGPQRHIKEKDLEGHLEAEKESDKKAEKKIKIKESAKENGDGSVDGKSEAVDIQRKRAIDYLKSWHIFKGMLSDAS